MVTVGDTCKKHELLFEEIKYELNVLLLTRIIGKSVNDT